MTDVQVGEVSPGAYPDAGVEEIRPWFQDCDEPGGGEGGEAPVVWSGEVAARAGAQVGTVQLTVPLTTYLKLADEPGEIGGYGPILGEVARTLAGNARDARWCVTVVNDKGEAIAHGDTPYRPGSKTRAMVQARDRTCRFPGCRRPAHRCDLDHSTPHDQGGATCPCNLAALCRRHHRLKQRNDWALHQVSPGVLMWVTPTDHWYMAQPDTYG
ncbi:HNH endonuclease signature motif containing protein [Spirillospora sp. NPDC047279]|uniref:HNH endonuclease signature motif containing protein n=1 Tax=Spirillospora sp. NPDC047279 TaxID=3155478 RepID=UPI0033E9C974